MIGHVCPVTDFVYVPEKENTFSLTPSDLFLNNNYRLHNPKGFILVFVSFELFHENWVFAWKVVSERKEVVLGSLLGLALFFKGFAIPFDIFR